MNEMILERGKTGLLSKIYGWLCLAALLLELGAVMFPETELAVRLLPLQIVTAGLLVAWLCSLNREISPEEKILAAWMIWTVISRLILGDMALGIQGSILWITRGCCLFAMGDILKVQRREKMFHIISGAVCCVLFFWAACGLIVVFTGSDYLPVVHKNIGLYAQQSVRSLSFFNLHRNETAPWFMVGLWLTVYYWVKCENRLWRIPLTVAAIVFYLTIALQHCRSVSIATSGGFSMLAMLALMPRPDQQKKTLRWMTAILAAVLCLAVFYKGLDLCDTAISRTADTTSKLYYQLRGWEMPAKEDPDENLIDDDRDLLQDMKTMTGRSRIWHAIIETRLAKPSLMLWGQQEEQLGDYLMSAGGMKFRPGHGHNMFMEAFAITGIPGLLLCLAFTVLVLRNMLVIFFRQGSMAGKILTIPMAGLLVYGMLEPLLSGHAMFASVCFALLAGLQRKR